MQNFFNKIKPSRFFIFAAILFELALTVVRPPMQSPDEFFHFCRAYQISEGHFLPTISDKRVGGELPVCLKEFLTFYTPLTHVIQYRLTREIFFDSFEIQCSDTSRVFVDFPNTSTYSPVAYLPHSIALFVLRQFNCSIAVQYFGSKLFAFIVYLLCMVFAIKTTPVYKWLLVALLLLPMNIYLVNSFTGDTMTNLLVFFLISLTMKHRFSNNKIIWKELALIFLIGILLSFTKVIYTTLLLLLLIIPVKNFGSVSKIYICLSVLILLPFILANLWSTTIMKYYPTFENYNENYRLHSTIHPTADPQKQMSHLLNNKTHIFKVIYNSIVHEPKFYLKSYIGHFGTYMDTALPDRFVITAYILLILISILEKNSFSFSWRDKIVMLLAVICAYSLIILSQHLVWNDIGREEFPSFQGRYLAPLFPLIFMMFNHSWSKVKFNPGIFVILFVLIGDFYSCSTLHKRYFRLSYLNKVSLYCDAEKFDSAGNLITTDEHLTLDRSGQKISTLHRSGEYSIALAPDSAKSFIYRFRNIEENDLVEIYAWQKGDGGEIVVEGKGDGCQPFRFRNEVVQLRDKNGWKKMQMIFSFFVKCKSSDIAFYVCNPTRDTIYFDDLTYKLTKFKK